MGRKTRVKDALTGQLVEVDADAIRQGPIRNPDLPDSLLQRVRAIHEAIRDMYTLSLEQFEIGFMRDAHPEREIAVWERIVAGFTKVTAALPEMDRKLVLRTLLAYSMNALSPDEQTNPDVRRIIEIACA